MDKIDLSQLSTAGITWTDGLLALAIVVAGWCRGALRTTSPRGVLLQTRHPVNIGDEIEVNGDVGTVAELNGRSVVLHTLDGRTIRGPDAVDHLVVDMEAVTEIDVTGAESRRTPGLAHGTEGGAALSPDVGSSATAPGKG